MSAEFRLPGPKLDQIGDSTGSGSDRRGLLLSPEGLTYQQEELAALIFDTGAISFTPQTLRIGETYEGNREYLPQTGVSIDFSKLEENKGTVIEVLSDAMLEMDFDGRLLSATPDMISTVRKMAKGTTFRVLEPIEEEKNGKVIRRIRGFERRDEGQKALIIESFVRTEAKIEGLAEELENEGVVAQDALVLVDFSTGIDSDGDKGGDAHEELLESGIDLFSIYTLNQLLDFGVRTGRITAEQRETALDLERSVKIFLWHDTGAYFSSLD